MYKHTRKIVVIVLVILFLMPFIPQSRSITEDVVTQALSTGVTDTWLQGESVSYEMCIPRKMVSTITEKWSEYGSGELLSYDIASSGFNDGFHWFLIADSDAGQGKIRIEGYFDTPYHDINSVIWEINQEGTASALNKIYWYWDTGARISTDIVAGSTQTGSRPMSSTYVINDRVYFAMNLDSSSGVAGDFVTYFDYFALLTNNITGTIRSEYYIVDPSSTLHRVEIECFDYGIDIQVDVPAHWDYQSCNPSASVSDVAGRVIITETVPTTYELYFTSDDSLRISNAREVWNMGFEGSWESYNTNTAGTRDNEYSTVFEGATSVRCYGAQWAGVEFPDQDYTQDVIVVFSIYEPTGTTIYFNWGSGNTRVDVDYALSDEWLTVCYAISGGITQLAIYSSNVAPDFSVDNIRVYDASLSGSDPNTGTAYHLSPYDTYAYQYDDLFGVVSTTTGGILENDTITTDTNGLWSNRFSSFTTAGNYNLSVYAVGATIASADNFTVAVQQLGFTSAELISFGQDQYQLSVTGATYADQLYNVTCEGIWIGTNIADGDLVDAINITGGDHDFSVYAIDREQGYYASDVYYLYLEASSSSSYIITASGECEIRIRDVSGHLLDYRDFTVWTNYSSVFARQYADTFTVSNIANAINVTVYDAFGRLINSSIMSYARVLVMETDISNVKIQNLQNYPIWIRWEYDGGTQSEWVPAHGEYEEFLLYIGAYNLTVSYSGLNANTTLSLNGTSVTYSLTLSSGEDLMIMVNGTMLDDILSNLSGTNGSITSLIVNLDGAITTLQGDVDSMEVDVYHIKQTTTGSGGNNLTLDPFQIFMLVVGIIIILAVMLFQTRDKYKWKTQAESRKRLLFMGNGGK